MKPETALKAAQWWREKIAAGEHHNNGANDMANELAMMMADMLAIKNTPSADQLSQFEMDLAGELMSLDMNNVSIHCDYHPDPILAKVANKNNISDTVFPYKTGMTISGDDIEVSEGYGAGYQKI